tara:strand:- start:21723 stop:22031 length:309 start_codon:yes stop_codon:yes gene_type:complete
MLRRIYILVIVALIVSTTFIKNYTKRLDQEIFSIKENINYLNDVKQLIQLEYDYLSSPERLLELNNLYLDEKLQHTPRKNINIISNVDKIILKISKIDEQRK